MDHTTYENLVLGARPLKNLYCLFCFKGLDIIIKKKTL